MTKNEPTVTIKCNFYWKNGTYREGRSGGSTQQHFSTLTGTMASDSSFHIRQFKPTTFPSPLKSIKFTSDTDTILLDPNIVDLSFGDPSSSFAEEANNAVAAETKGIGRIQLAGARKRLFYDPVKTQVGIVTCGGVCPGLNNVIRALVNILFYRYKVQKIVGFRYGFQGLVPGKSISINLTPQLVKDIHLFGGTILGTSRGPQDPKIMVDFLCEQKIDILFCIGGDGTQKGAHSIANEIISRDLKISVVGVGKTIDNDLLFIDKSFGFETAIQLSQQSIIAAHEEARSAHNGIGVVKLMGRESGAIALTASIANGDVNVLLVPEVPFTIQKLADYLVERFKTRDHCVIVCAEGAGQNLLGDTGKKDARYSSRYYSTNLYSLNLF